MHPSQHAASTWSPLPSSQQADQFSFPPTQRTGLLASPTSSPQQTGAPSHDDERCDDQRENLKHSLDRLLDALDCA